MRRAAMDGECVCEKGGYERVEMVLYVIGWKGKGGRWMIVNFTPRGTHSTVCCLETEGST